LLVTDNQVLKAGELLLEIDPRDYQAALDQAQADVRSADADIRNLDAQIVQQQAVIDQARADISTASAGPGRRALKRRTRCRLDGCG
jgi:membrane fusion protein (multidrug efflux system)